MFYKVAAAICALICKIAFKFKVAGLENIPAEGAFILAPNHKSFFDPVVVAVKCKRQIRFMAKAELFKNKLFGKIITALGAFPLQRGKGDIAAIKAAFSILKEGNVLLMFPQGKRIKDDSRGNLKTGVAVIAHKMQVPVVPVSICGKYKFRSKITVTYGKPIYFDEFYGQKLDDETTTKLAAIIYEGIFSPIEQEMQ